MYYQGDISQDSRDQKKRRNGGREKRGGGYNDYKITDVNPIIYRKSSYLGCRSPCITTFV